MRISELSVATGVPVATIKFYLREKVLTEGRRASATQAEYDDHHVARLGVIRALVDAGVGIAGVRRMVAVLDDPPATPYELLGAANAAVTPSVDVALDLAPAHELIARMGADASECYPEQVAAVAAALATLDRAGFTVPAPVLTAYLEGLQTMAEAELSATPTDSADAAVRYVVLGTVLVEPLLLALRRVAEQAAAARRFPAA